MTRDWTKDPAYTEFIIPDVSESELKQHQLCYANCSLFRVKVAPRVDPFTEVLQWIHTEFRKSFLSCRNHGKLKITAPCFFSTVWDGLFPLRVVEPLGWIRHTTPKNKEIIRVVANWNSLNWLLGEHWHEAQELNSVMVRRLLYQKGIKFTYQRDQLKFSCTARVAKYNVLNMQLW